MFRIYAICALAFFTSCSTATFYVVRHAEKDPSVTMTTDVPLSAAGRERAQALGDLLKGEPIRAIYSTNYVRTKATVQPVADARGLTVQTYDPRDTSFAGTLLTNAKGKLLIVGHSNTVDDIVNRLAGTVAVPGDLPDSQYGDLWIIRKKGKRFSYEKKHFGR